MSQTNTKATHTPGPWRVIGDEVWTDTSPTGAYDSHLANTLGLGPENNANARLMAAAPDLLAALGEVLHLAETPGDFTDEERDNALMDAGALIERAKGV